MKDQPSPSSVELVVWLGERRIWSCTHLGGMLAVQVGRKAFGISPTAGDDGSIGLAFNSLRSVKAEQAPGKALGELRVTPGRTTPVRDVPGVDDVKVRVRPRDCGGRPGGVATGWCCVRCGDVTACGCAVTMDCGSCCAGDCC